jgi:hypothetical protein
MMRTVSVGRQSAKLTRGKIAAVENAAAPDNIRRREKALLVTNSLPALIFVLQGSVGSAQPAGKRTTWRRCDTVPRMLRSGARLRPGALLIRGPSMKLLGPGSAEQRYTLHCVRDTSVN